MSNLLPGSPSLHADPIAIVAVIGAPYVMVCRRWNERHEAPNQTPVMADDSQHKAINNGKQEAKAGDPSIAEILQGDSRELAKLRDAVK